MSTDVILIPVGVSVCYSLLLNIMGLLSSESYYHTMISHIGKTLQLQNHSLPVQRCLQTGTADHSWRQTGRVRVHHDLSATLPKTPSTLTQFGVRLGKIKTFPKLIIMVESTRS